MVGIANTQDVIQLNLQLSWTGHFDSEEILLMVITEVLEYGKSYLQTSRIHSPGRTKLMLHGRMYDERAEDCCRTALASVFGMNK